MKPNLCNHEADPATFTVQMLRENCYYLSYVNNETGSGGSYPKPMTGEEVKQAMAEVSKRTF